jgi:hypothetical protein
MYTFLMWSHFLKYKNVSVLFYEVEEQFILLILEF